MGEAKQLSVRSIVNLATPSDTEAGKHVVTDISNGDELEREKKIRELREMRLRDCAATLALFEQSVPSSRSRLNAFGGTIVLDARRDENETQ